MSFKSGYMAQRSACAPEADSRWVLQVVNKDGEQSCLSSLPPPACFIQIFGHSRCALQGLDSPASRDQINDRDN